MRKRFSLLAASAIVCFILFSCDTNQSNAVTWTFTNDCAAAKYHTSGYYPIKYITVTPIGSEDDTSFSLEIGESKCVAYPLGSFAFSFNVTAGALNPETMEYDSLFTYNDMTIDTSSLQGKTTTYTIRMKRATVIPDASVAQTIKFTVY